MCRNYDLCLRYVSFFNDWWNVGVAKANTEVKNAKRLAVPTWRGLDAKRLRVGYVVHYGGASKPHYIVRTHRVDGSDLGPSRCVEAESITSSSFSWQCAAACVYTHTHTVKLRPEVMHLLSSGGLLLFFSVCVCVIVGGEGKRHVFKVIKLKLWASPDPLKLSVMRLKNNQEINHGILN